MVNCTYKYCLTALAVLLNTFIASAQIHWNDSTSTGWKDSTHVSVNPNIPQGKVTSLQLSKTRLLLAGGETERLVAVINADAANKSVTWSVADNSIATVSQNGEVKALVTGQTVVTATAVDGGLKAQCIVTVKNNALVYVERIELDKTELTMYVGETALITPTVYPSNASNKQVVWGTEILQDCYIPCSITQEGYATAIKPGRITYVVRPQDGAEAIAKVQITVKDKPVSSITLPSTISLNINEMKTLNPTVTPELMQPMFRWTTADPSIAYVNASGRIVGCKTGETTVTATAVDGTGKSCSARVVVSSNEANWGYSGWVLERGENVHPWTARYYNEHDVFEIGKDNNGKAWYELGFDDSEWRYGYGPMTFYCWHGGLGQDGYAAFGQWNDPESYLFLRQEFYMPDVNGYDFNLYARTTNGSGDIYLNGKKIAITDVTGWNGKGTYMAQLDYSQLNMGGMNVIAIKARHDNWTQYVDFGIHYERSIPVTRIILSEKQVTLPQCATHKLSAIIKPNEVTRPNLTWKSSDEHVAIVLNDGTVLTLSPGKAVISACATDGSGVVGKCEVTVTEEFGTEESLPILPRGSVLLSYVGDSYITLPKDNAGNDCTNMDFDDSQWKPAQLAMVYQYGDEYNGETYYFRHKFYMPDVKGKYVLRMDSWFTGRSKFWINGVLIGEIYEHEGHTRDIPAELLNYGGENILTVSRQADGQFIFDCWMDLFKMIPVESITLSHTSLTLDQEQQVHLEAYVKPDDAYYREVKWTSDNPNIASVDEWGNVTGMGEGTANISATAIDGSGVKAACQVTVTRYKSEDDFWILQPGRDGNEWEARYLYCRVGDHLYNNGPANDSKQRAWTDPEYSDGTWQTITGPIGHEVGWHIATWWPDNDSRYYLRSHFTLGDVSEYGNLRLNTIHDDGMVAWINGIKIQDTDYNTEEENIIPAGVLKQGDNIICIQVSEGGGGAYVDYGIKGSKRVEVKPVTAVTLDINSITLKQNQRATLTATITPEDAYYKEVKWTTSNPDVVTVNQEGNIHAGFAGKAYVKVANTHGTVYSDSCLVTVTDEILPLQPGDWVLPNSEEGAWNAKAIYAPREHAYHDAEPANDTDGNKWTSLNYNDDEWQSIEGPLNRDYGNWPDDDSRYYVRRKFVVGDLSDINSIKLYIKHDDNALVYLNGIFVADCPDWSGGGYREFLLPKGLLCAGQNIVCVNIYQGGGGAELDFGLMGCEEPGPAIAEKLSFSAESYTMQIGRKKTLTVKVEPAGAPRPELKWDSSDTAVATVDNNGRVEALTLGTTTISVTATIGNNTLSASCELTVTEKSASTGALPDVPFEFNYNAFDYDEDAHSITNNPMAELADYDLLLSENIPVYDAEEGSLDIQNICCGWINRWERESWESGDYFYRQGEDDMTIICKVAPRFNGTASDFIANRAGGYNYMLRIGDNGRFFLHTDIAYQDNRTLALEENTEQVLAVRVNGSENYIQLDNLTTGESLHINEVRWGGSGNAFKFFYNDGGEFYTGKFYWVYYSKELLDDDDLQKVSDYNESPVTILPGDANSDGTISVADLTLIASYILGETVQNINLKAADVNGDSVITVADLTSLASIILGLAE